MLNIASTWYQLKLLADLSQKLKSEMVWSDEMFDAPGFASDFAKKSYHHFATLKLVMHVKQQISTRDHLSTLSGLFFYAQECEVTWT